MITLLCEKPGIHTYFEARPRISFQWVVYGVDMQFRSDWQLLSEATDLDKYLLSEFMSQFRAWNEIESSARLAYLDARKKALSFGEHWFERTFPSTHRVFEVYSAARNELTDELLIRHPSGQFCTVKPSTPDTGGYFAFCRSRIWSSPEWLPPKKWLEVVDGQ